MVQTDKTVADTAIVAVEVAADPTGMLSIRIFTEMQLMLIIFLRRIRLVRI